MSVLQLILQFLKEHDFNNVKELLEKESGIRLNSLESDHELVTAIQKGHWDVVIRILNTLSLSPSVLVPIYEQMIFELWESKDLKVASTLLHQTQIMAFLREWDSERYHWLESCLAKEFSAKLVINIVS